MTWADLEPFWLSLRVAGLATAGIVTVGLPMAIVLARGRFVGREWLGGLVMLPLVLPPTVLGYGLLLLLGRGSTVGDLLERRSASGSFFTGLER